MGAFGGRIVIRSLDVRVFTPWDPMDCLGVGRREDPAKPSGGIKDGIVYWAFSLALSRKGCRSASSREYSGAMCSASATTPLFSGVMVKLIIRYIDTEGPAGRVFCFWPVIPSPLSVR